MEDEGQEFGDTEADNTDASEYCEESSELEEEFDDEPESIQSINGDASTNVVCTTDINYEPIPPEVIKRKFGGKQRNAGRPKGSGRKKTELDPEILERISETMLSQNSIAIIMGCSVDTIRRHYMSYVHKGREKRKLSLVEAMWNKAIVEKDCKMQIWLSKQHLGYKESHPDESHKVNFNVIVAQVPK